MADSNVENAVIDSQDESKSLGDIEAKLKENFKSVDGFIKKSTEEMKAIGEVSAETKSAVVKLTQEGIDLADKLHGIEQKMVGSDDKAPIETIGEQFTKCDSWKDMQEGKTRNASLEVKTAIVNATGQNQPLVAADRIQGIFKDPDRVLRVVDLIPRIPTSSNLVEFARENVFTDNAGPQVGASPEVFENTTKPESGITFTLASEAVQTLAHWIPASKQVLGDSPMLQGYINMRLGYGLKLEEETQVLSGSGANGNLNGLTTQQTAFAQNSPIEFVVTTKMDEIRAAILQAQQSEYVPDAIVLHHNDWANMEVEKVNAGTDNRYLMGNPAGVLQPRLWGLPVVATNSMTSGDFLVGSFRMGAALHDRESMTIEVSRENSTNFVDNMITILAEERVCLCVYRTQAFIGGTFSV